MRALVGSVQWLGAYTLGSLRYFVDIFSLLYGALGNQIGGQFIFSFGKQLEHHVHALMSLPESCSSTIHGASRTLLLSVGRTNLLDGLEKAYRV